MTLGGVTGEAGKADSGHTGSGFVDNVARHIVTR